MSGPSPRSWPFAVSTEDKFYLWGGDGDTDPKNLSVYGTFVKSWTEQFTQGQHPPAGLYNGCCTIADHRLFFYGGDDGSSFSAALHQINVEDWSWKELANCSTDGPGRKIGCKMINYNGQLLLIGGEYGKRNVPVTKQLGAKYDQGYTDEIHCYNLTDEIWSSPPVCGSRPPPCSNFSLTMIDEEHALMFGGYSPVSGFSADVNILHLPTMSWTPLPHNDGDPRPEGRSSHIAVCLGYGEQHKRVLISGGWNGDQVLNDTWLLDLQSGSWEKVQVSNRRLLQRQGHCAAPIIISPKCVEVVLFGGRRNFGRSNIADTVVMRFEFQTNSYGEKSWVVTDVANQTQLSSPEGQQRQLETMKIQIEESDKMARQLIEQLEESQRRAEQMEKEEKELEEKQKEYKRKEDELRKKKENLDMKADESKQKNNESETRATKVQETVDNLQRRINETAGGHVINQDGFLSVQEEKATYAGKEIDIDFKNLGLQMHLENQDLPENANECPISVSVAITGEFDLPGSSDLVSGVYKIDSSLEPKKPITITIQHYAAGDSIDNLRFASSTDKSPPFTYKIMKGGDFTSSHGTIKINEFCYYTILYKYGKKGLRSWHENRYQLTLHCSKTPTVETPSQLSWSLFFTMVKNCDIFQNCVNKYFHDLDCNVEQLDSIVVQFNKDSEEISLTLQDDRMDLESGWSIISVVACSFKKHEVDSYADGRPPQFRLILLQNGELNPTDLLNKFMFSGAAVPEAECFINLIKSVAAIEGSVDFSAPELNYGTCLSKIDASKQNALKMNIENDCHLFEIAKYLHGWQDQFDLFHLERNPDFEDILNGINKDNPKLQRVEVLQLWKERSSDPTFDALLKICLEGHFIDSAKVIISIVNKIKI